MVFAYGTFVFDIVLGLLLKCKPFPTAGWRNGSGSSPHRPSPQGMLCPLTESLCMAWPYSFDPLQVNYTVQTVTGNMPGAGTSANVFITLHGTLGDSKRVQLSNSVYNPPSSVFVGSLHPGPSQNTNTHTHSLSLSLIKCACRRWKELSKGTHRHFHREGTRSRCNRERDYFSWRSQVTAETLLTPSKPCGPFFCIVPNTSIHIYIYIYIYTYIHTYIHTYTHITEKSMHVTVFLHITSKKYSSQGHCVHSTTTRWSVPNAVHSTKDSIRAGISRTFLCARGTANGVFLVDVSTCM
jgi:hypothetical protein